MRSWVFGVHISLLALGVLGKPQPKMLQEHPERFSDFDMKLTKLVAANEKSNVVLSPISVKLVLAMLYEGSRGNTAKELQKILDIKDSKAISANRLSIILQSLQASNKGYDIAVGTRLFIDDEAKPAPAFEQRIKNLYNGSIETIDFQKTSEAVSTINAWTKTVTRGHIKNILSEIDSKENTVLLLVNALYFKGLWENQFPLNQTKDDTFFVDGVSPIKVPFMNAVHNLDYVESGDLKSSVVRLPYQGGKFAMYIMLPFEKNGLLSLVKEMTAEKVRKAVSEMQPISVQIKLPRFDFEFSASLAPVLRELGLNDMFSPNADLSGIAKSDKDLVVSNVIQKTALEVNEQGTVAAVATSVDLTSKFGEHIVDFEATHPFILYIEDETTNTVVFVARVSNPEGSGKPILSASAAAPSPPASHTVLSAPSGVVSQKNDQLDQETFSYLDIELMKEFQGGDQNNWVMSPASIKTALSLVYEGANGETAEELGMAMRLPENSVLARGQLLAFQRSLQTPSNLTSVRSASRVLVRKGMQVKEPYRMTVGKDYGGDVVTADFDHPDEVVKEVNAWCNDITKGAIPQIISSGSLTADSSLIIVNAIYFHAKWKTQFESTTKGCFITGKDECTMTDMMRVRGTFRKALVPTLNSYVIELPYEDSRYSLVIVLPTRRNGIRQVVKDLAHNPLGPILERLPFNYLILHVPKFTAEYSQSLKKVLIDLGVNTMFSDASDLSGMFGGPAHTKVTDVIHKAKIDVTEDGTTASAGTAVFAETLSQSSAIPFKVDHPFLFFIHDAAAGSLFGGQYSKPKDGQPIQMIKP
uniref:Serpin domain-containing protein n=1 Tax=Lygus hesperus TaxID=30085 RepID=A0A0K8SVN5_LYGHE